MDHVIGFATKGISRGIAISSEAIAGRKNKNSVDGGTLGPSQTTPTRTLDSTGDEEGVYVDQEWAFDEATGEGTTEDTVVDPSDTAPANSAEEVAQAFIQNHHFSRDVQVMTTPLPMAVVIPQRRPRDRGRGFVRAYPPMLDDCAGISQDVFIDFLNSFDKASKTSPIFDVINIACFGVGLVPSTVCFAVSMSVGTVNNVAQEIQRRYRSNKFLDQINEAVFKPRGLFAMVMTYKPDMPEEGILRVDTSTDANSVALFKTLSGSSDTLKIKERLRRLRISSGTATEASFPECAPLIYPSLELVLQSNAVTPSNTSSLSPKSPVVQDYLDRRAQAQFAHDHRGAKLSSTLPPQTKQFVNRFADPNHPVNSGSLYGLVTGGRWDPVASSRIRRAEAKAKKNGEPPLTAEERHDAYMGRKVRGRVTGTPSKNIPLIGKILKKDVLYLTIVNLPTQEEMDRWKEEMTKA